jgi:hypothetical protein
MFPLSIGTYVKLGLACVALLGSAYLGYSFEHSRFMVFKAEVETVAREQEAKNKSVQKQQALVNKGIVNEFQAKLGALRNRYDGVQYTGGSQLPTLSNPAGSINGTSANFTLDCAITTQQLVSLQDWIRESATVK